MDLREKTLKDIEGFFEKKSSSIENICFFMQKLRLLLEIDNSKSKYKILNHYCNWLFHKHLDRNTSEIINNIGNCFENFNSEFDLLNKVNSSISVEQLVIEIKEILYKNKIGFEYDNFIENNDFWKAFIQNIFFELRNRPVLLEKNKNVKDKKIENFEVDFSIYGIQIVSINNEVAIEILSKELEIMDKNLYLKFYKKHER